ncbi:MAG TPA: hypothetical protein VK452_09435 [Dissulfurispiraceae bacterium]|nr:hypothetical protein [Dissulfurispiraceae bacterium]
MTILVSFIAGAVLFYLHRFFPYTSGCIVFVLLAAFALFTFRAHEVSSQRYAAFHSASAVLVVVFMLAAGYYRASSSYITPLDLELLSGETIKVKAVAISEATPVQSGRSYIQEVEILGFLLRSRPIPISHMHVYSDLPLRE